LGNQTVMSGYVTTGKNDPSQSLQMMGRPLMTSDELKALPKGSFIVTKTGTHPMRTKLELFFRWGIIFDAPYEITEHTAREVKYADSKQLETSIIKKYPPKQKSVSASAPTPDVLAEPKKPDEKQPVRLG
jgi:type IV secretion system protein VirD4